MDIVKLVSISANHDHDHDRHRPASPASLTTCLVTIHPIYLPPLINPPREEPLTTRQLCSPRRLDDDERSMVIEQVVYNNPREHMPTPYERVRRRPRTNSICPGGPRTC